MKTINKQKNQQQHETVKQHQIWTNWTEIKYQTIRHETPVLDHPIRIIHIDNDVIALDKPCSLPVSKIRTKHKIVFHFLLLTQID